MAKKEGVRKLFDNIAHDYDKLNHILSLNIDKGWRKKAVRELADTDKPIKVLDGRGTYSDDFRYLPYVCRQKSDDMIRHWIEAMRLRTLPAAFLQLMYW